MKKLILFILFALLYALSFAQQTLVKVKDWNAYVYLPADYSITVKDYPTILFTPGLGEIGTNADRLIANGPGSYLKQGWNGEASGIKFIIISLQPPTAWPGPSTVKERIDILKTQYRIGDLYMTGLSMGGWTSLYYSYTYPSEVKAVVGVESVVPSQGDGTDYEQRIHDTYKVPAQAGQKYLLFEQKNDWRRNDQVVDAMNFWAPGSAWYEKSPNGTQGFISVPLGNRTNGSSFVIKSTSAMENSTVDWILIN